MFISPSVGTENFTEQEKAAIHEQLERLLANPFFSHSRRFPIFLRYIVEHTLSGRSEVLKERTLGVEVFGKSADYDTASDPIVRVTAAEIRKRIALYYQEAGHEEELRLSLPPGSYIPQFHWPQTVVRSEPNLAQESRPQVGELLASEEKIRHRHSRLAVVSGLLVGILLSLLGLFAWSVATRSPVRSFWSPILSSTDPVLFCVADQLQYTAITLRDAADPSRQITMQDNLTAIVIDDLGPIVKLAGILQTYGKKYNVAGEGNTSLTALRAGPDILIGAYDNVWTLRLLKPLRFHFANNPEMTRLSIVDSQAHSPSSWVVDRGQQFATNIYRDYAIVARFNDNTTGRRMIVAAGIARGGTIAAGEFLTDPTLLRQIEHLPGYATGKNIEVVLSTQIIGGQPGTPRIEASYIW